MVRKKQWQSKAAGVTRMSLEVIYPGKARTDAHGFLNDGQSLELEDVVQRLDGFGSKRETWDLDIQKAGDLWKLTHTGTSLGPLVAEVYFAYLPSDGVILVLGVSQKGSVSREWVYLERMKNRLAHYLRVRK